MITVSQFLIFKNEVTREINTIKSLVPSGSSNISDDVMKKIEKLEQIFDNQNSYNSQIHTHLQNEIEDTKKLLYTNPCIVFSGGIIPPSESVTLYHL